ERSVRVRVVNSSIVNIPNLVNGYGIFLDHVADTFLTNLEISTAQDATNPVCVILDTGVDGLYASHVNTAQGLYGLLLQSTKTAGYSGVYNGVPSALFFNNLLADTTPGGHAIL